MVIISILILSIILMLVIFITIREIKPLIESTIETKNKQAQVNEYELFIQFDIDKAKSILNDYIDDYIANYAFYNFAVQSLEYINQEDAETMIKEITKSIVINLSELYIFYVKMLRNISNDEDLVLYIRDLVKERSLAYITEFNKPT